MAPLVLLVALLAGARVLTQDLRDCSARKGVIGRFLCRVDLHLIHSVDERNEEGDTLLMQAFYNIPSVPANPQRDARALETAAWLIAEGVDVQAVNLKGRSLLIDAVVAYDLPLVRFLISQGADPHAKGTGEFATLSAALLADKLSEFNVRVARGLLACDEAALKPPSPEGMSEGLASILSYQHMRTASLVADVLGKSPSWSECQPLSPEETERIMTAALPVLSLAELRSALSAR